MNKFTKKSAIYDHILNKLMTCQYRFGEKIMVKHLTEKTGVSRQPIMSALSKLQERGFVEITAQVGCVVSKPGSQEVSDFYRMFSANEGLVALLAAERAMASEKKRLIEINEKIGLIAPQHSDADVTYRRLNRQFHHQIHLMARSPMVSSRQMANFEFSDFLIVQSCGFRHHLETSVTEHETIIEALANGDSKGARTVTMEHIDSIAGQVLMVMRDEEREPSVP